MHDRRLPGVRASAVQVSWVLVPFLVRGGSCLLSVLAGHVCLPFVGIVYLAVLCIQGRDVLKFKLSVRPDQEPTALKCWFSNPPSPPCGRAPHCRWRPLGDRCCGTPVLRTLPAPACSAVTIHTRGIMGGTPPGTAGADELWIERDLNSNPEPATLKLSDLGTSPFPSSGSQRSRCSWRGGRGMLLVLVAVNPHRPGSDKAGEG